MLTLRAYIILILLPFIPGLPPLSARTHPCQPDTIAPVTRHIDNPYRFRWTQLAIPAGVITLSAIGSSNGWLRHHGARQSSGGDRPSLYVEDALQYSPYAAYYGMQLCGMRGIHDYVDKTILLGTSALLMAVTVKTLKYTTHVERPDGSQDNSFPSGHSAIAFMGAELLRHEYPRCLPAWIGGYAVATLTAALRLHNHRHWLTDVTAGAGIGVLSVNAAYWLYPWMCRMIFRGRVNHNILLAPSVSTRSAILTANITF